MACLLPAQVDPEGGMWLVPWYWHKSYIWVRISTSHLSDINDISREGVSFIQMLGTT